MRRHRIALGAGAYVACLLGSILDPTLVAAQGHGLTAASFPHLAERLRIEDAAAQPLIEQLVRPDTPDPLERERQLDAVALGLSQSTTTQDVADRYSTERAALRRLLGEQSFGRFLDYMGTRAARQQVAALEQRLTAVGADTLACEPRERLVKLFDLEQRRGELEYIVDFPDARADTFLGASAARARQLRHVRMRELLVLRQQRYVAQRVAAAARVLTPDQHAVYTALQAEWLESWRARLRRARSNAGLDPDAAIPPEPSLQPLARQLSWAVSVAVNGAERRATFASASGQAVAFQASAGLWIEAQPFVYGTTLAVVLEVHETLADGRHRIDVLFEVAPLQSRLDLHQWTGTRSERAIAGSSGYVLTTQVAGALL